MEEQHLAHASIIEDFVGWPKMIILNNKFPTFMVEVIRFIRGTVALAERKIFIRKQQGGIAPRWEEQ